jgi:hydroxyacylglutathione hydrolase
MVGGSVKVDDAFSDGKKFDLGRGMEIEMFHTPGHSPGSTSMWLKKEGILFPGDAVPLPGDMPIYDDAAASIGSLEKMQQIRGISTLLSSWDIPRHGGEVQAILMDGLDYLNLIHLTISDALDNEPMLTDPDLCRRVLNELGLVRTPAMPLIVRSFRSNRDRLRSC